MHTHDRIYIDGAWVPSEGTGTIDVVEAATEAVIGTIPDGVPADVDRAVSAARRAFAGWSVTPASERAKHLNRVADGLARRADEIAELASREVGMARRLSAAIQAGLPLAAFQNAAAIIEDYRFEETDGNALIVKEPVGVVGAITPWNYPLHQVAAKVAWALAAGCTVVVKPSEVAPLTAFVLAELIDEVGLPPGVFNLVTGVGPIVGEALAAHPEVDMVSFTGSTRAGRRVAELTAARVARVALELGGKSPNVLLDDLEGASLERAVKDGVNKAFLNSGQTCSALTRMIVPRDRLAEVEALAAAAAATMTLGNPLDDATRLGPVASAAQRERVRGYIRSGLEEGARLVCGGAEPPEGLSQGYYVKPTVFSDVRNDMTIAREEIFGPVLSIIPYDGEDEAVRIANDSPYGLAGGVWSADAGRAEAVARRIRSGQVEVNGGAFNPTAPFGGFKQSGHGRESGRYGLEEFLEPKALLK